MHIRFHIKQFRVYYQLRTLNKFVVIIIKNVMFEILFLKFLYIIIYNKKMLQLFVKYELATKQGIYFFLLIFMVKMDKM